MSEQTAEQPEFQIFQIDGGFLALVEISTGDRHVDVPMLVEADNFDEATKLLHDHIPRIFLGGESVMARCYNGLNIIREGGPVEPITFEELWEQANGAIASTGEPGQPAGPTPASADA